MKVHASVTSSKGIDPAFLALPGAAAALAAGHKLQLHKDEQSPATYNRGSSKYTPPVGFNPDTGAPIYNGGHGLAPTNRENHGRNDYRAYADVKYEFTTAGVFPKWVWWTLAAGAVAMGLAIALRKK
jgi:hypothetical protein